ncbi:hypothetical protein G6F42_020451 [Rhizopus arrhizus]|nr:hypothetical protein G6F42_020451 [Rhizopus arrhizus]
MIFYTKSIRKKLFYYFGGVELVAISCVYILELNLKEGGQSLEHRVQCDVCPAATTTTTTTAATTKSNATGGKIDNKYSCPYCSKGFSRPSSLRIHTYSHTGERPFECPEAGCSRKFSVQSNMRRHLRVHRLGRPLKRNGGLISPADRAHLINKPLAAKPSTTASSNWIGVTVYPSSS